MGNKTTSSYEYLHLIISHQSLLPDDMRTVMSKQLATVIADENLEVQLIVSSSLNDYKYRKVFHKWQTIQYYLLDKLYNFTIINMRLHNKVEPKSRNLDRIKFSWKHIMFIWLQRNLELNDFQLSISQVWSKINIICIIWSYS